MEPVRGVKRRDRQGGRRSWWSKGEHLPESQQKELRELVAAVEKAEEEEEKDATPMRRTRRISWWGKGEDAKSQLQELQAAADEEASERNEVPNSVSMKATENDAAPMRPQRRGTRRISWWGKGEDASSQLQELQAAADEEPSEKNDTFVPMPLQRRTARRMSWWNKGSKDAKDSEDVKREGVELSKAADADDSEMNEDSSERNVTEKSTEQPLASQPDKRRLPQRVSSVRLSADEGKKQRKKWWPSRKRGQSSPTTNTETED